MHAVPKAEAFELSLSSCESPAIPIEQPNAYRSHEFMAMRLAAVGILPARSGSTRLPDRALKPIPGMPMARTLKFMLSRWGDRMRLEKGLSGWEAVSRSQKECGVFRTHPV